MKKGIKQVLKVISYSIMLSTIVNYTTAPVWIQGVTLMAGLVYFCVTNFDEEDKDE